MATANAAAGVKIREFRERLAALGGTPLRTNLAGALGATALKLTLAGFRNSTDPYGNRWADVARGGKPLIKTGALRQSVALETTPSGFTIALADPVAIFHQEGTRPRQRRKALMTRARAAARFAGKVAGPGGIRPRPMLPIASRGLGPIWRSELDRATASVLRNMSSGR